ncbi:anti-sigma factor [Nocardioides scoriae]|uniref:anti-sigma factor n=1 Tax=Nocardioides scoriae TaxID=642780 RepID=UPI000B8068C5|nr:anti-sigma factor [Nocardioides scoriae]
MTSSIHALSGAYVVDALDDEERSVFEEHLTGCRDCQVEVAELREAAAVLPESTLETPPASLRASVLAGVATVRPLPPEVDAAERVVPVRDEAPTADVVPLAPRRRGRRLANLAAAAVVLGVVGVGAVTQPWEPERSAPSATLSVADRVLSADDAEEVTQRFPDGSSATVTRSRAEGKAVLTTKRMAAPPSGRVFEMWLRDAEGRMRPAGLMTSGGDQTFVLRGDGATATGVGITVEPEGGSSAPTSDPIAMMDLGQGTA